MHTLSTRSHCAAIRKTKQWMQVVHVRALVEDSLTTCKELKSAENASTLTQKLAEETIFDVDIMNWCTSGETNELSL